MKANKKILGLILLIFGFLFYLSGNVFAPPGGPGPGGNATNFSFYGYTYKTNGEVLNGTNVTVQIYVFQQGPPTLVGEYSTLSNGSGFFNLTLPGNFSYHYKAVIRHFNDSNLDYIGKSLPAFPYMEFSHLNAEIKFYLWEGATINLTVFSNPRKFDNVSTVWTNELNMSVVNSSSPPYGLEWNNNTKKWAYLVLGTPNSLILLNPDFTFNKSYPLNNFLSLQDLELVNDSWYYLINQSGHIKKYYDNETSLILTQTYNLSRSYINVKSMEYDYCNGSLLYYISAINASGNVTLDRYLYNGTDFLFNESISPFDIFGKLERPNCNSWFIITEGGVGGNSEFLKLRNDFSIDADGHWGTDFLGLGIEQFPGYLSMEEGLYVLSNDNVSRRIKLYDDGTKNFSYMIKDTKLGYPVDELVGQGVSVSQRTIYVPANRNYSIAVFPQEAFPFNYEINNLSDYPSPKYVKLHLNASESLIWVSGYATLNGLANFDNLYILGYTIEPGNMAFYDWPIPCNISSWRRNASGDSLNESDYFNATSGFYNLTLIGSAQGSKILLYVIAKINETYYGAFKNISLSAVSADIKEFNFSLQPLIGSVIENISCQVFGGENLNIETKTVKFRLQNESGSSASSAHVSMNLDYSTLGSTAFYWMIDVTQQDDGNLTLPLLNSSIDIEIFTPDFAPLSTTLSANELSAEQVNITLTSFNPGAIGNETFSDLFLDMLVNNATCNVPYPSQSCSLIPRTNFTRFNPLSIVMGGGELSFRMGRESSGITVHYTNVDLLASGPPDALFDPGANSTQNQSTIEQAWRFGSTGPEIYDSVLVGMPYNDSEINESAPINVLIEKLYDENWEVIWDADVNSTDEIPEKYRDFDMDWFNVTTNGVLCNTTNESAMCYVNTTYNMVWIHIPHFSGLGPNLNGEPPGSPPTQIKTILLQQGWNLISIPLNITT